MTTTKGEITISKVNIKKILGKMVTSPPSPNDTQYRLVAPASNGKKIDFLEITDIDEIIMDDHIPYKSPKEFFFPRCEKLLSFCGDRVEPCKPEKPTIIFGVKPCDLEALDVMAEVFMEGKFKDPFFAAHLENNLLIGVGCSNKKEGCFCNYLSVDMRYSNKCDLFLENIEDSYRVCYVSGKGREKLSPFIPELSVFENTNHLRQCLQTMSNAPTVSSTPTASDTPELQGKPPLPLPQCEPAFLTK